MCVIADEVWGRRERTRIRATRSLTRECKRSSKGNKVGASSGVKDNWQRADLHVLQKKEGEK